MDFKIPPAYEQYLRVGTCSWKFDSWKGLLYPEGKTYAADEYLPLYARQLATVEIDQWFWSLFPSGVRLPESRTVRTYAASVPDDFLFTIKVPNSITLTHFYAKQPKNLAEFANKPNEHFLSIELLTRFLDRLAPLEGKIGPIMFQFEYLNKKKMPSKELFIGKLGDFFDRAPSGFQYAIETRNPNYLSSELFEFLAARRIGFVFLEGYYMPSIADVFDAHDTATADFSIIRLHGGDREEMESATGEVWNKIVAPRQESLASAARIVRANSMRGIRTFVNVNNHYEGSAPLTIKRFITELEKT